MQSQTHIPVPLEAVAAKVPPAVHPLPPETILITLIPYDGLMVAENPPPSEAEPSLHVLVRRMLPGT